MTMPANYKKYLLIYSFLIVFITPSYCQDSSKVEIKKCFISKKNEIGISVFGIIYRRNYSKGNFRYLFNFLPFGSKWSWDQGIRNRLGYQFNLTNKRFQPYLGGDLALEYSWRRSLIAKDLKSKMTTLGILPVAGFRLKLSNSFSTGLEVSPSLLYVFESKSTDNIDGNTITTKNSSQYFKFFPLYSINLNLSYHF
jgi:hypothetical protein